MSVIRDMINKKKEMMAKQNAIDAGQSKVVGMTEDGARIIENGEDKFIVSEGLETGLNKLFAYDYQHRYFTVKDEDGNSKSLDIIVRKKKYPYEEYYKDLALNSFYLGPTKENIEFETNMTGNIYERYIGSQKDLSLNNINVLRYQLKNDMEASYFLDKFVIVTQEERQAYQEYAALQDMKEKQAKEAQEQAARLAKIRARQERRDSRKQAKIQKKEQKIQAKAKLAEEAEKKALEKKIEEKFFGRK